MKFRSMAHRICELLWIQSLLKDMGFFTQDPMYLYCYNRQLSRAVEFRSIEHGICEFLKIQGLLRELGFIIQSPMSLYCDNRASIRIAQNMVQNDRIKLIKVDRHFFFYRHFIKQKKQSGKICTPFVKNEQLADLCTRV